LTNQDQILANDSNKNIPQEGFSSTTPAREGIPLAASSCFSNLLRAKHLPMLVVAIAKEARVCPCKKRRYQKAPK